MSQQDDGSMRKSLEGSSLGHLIASKPIVMQTPALEVEAPVLEERKSLWRSYLDKMNSDPNMRMALMNMGAQLLRSPQMGQNRGDVAANAIGSSIGMYAQNKLAGQQGAREDKKLGIEEKKADSDIKTGEQNAETYSQVGGAQVRSADASIARGQAATATEQAATALNAELEPRKVAADEKRAEADRIRAEAYRTGAGGGGRGGNPGQNVTLIQNRKAALMAINPNLSDEEATLQAQNDVLFNGKSSTNPAQIAVSTYQTLQKAWNDNPDNWGKVLSPEQDLQMKMKAKELAKEFGALNRAPTEPIARVGAIIDEEMTLNDQSTAFPTNPGASHLGEPESLVGKKVLGKGGVYLEVIREGGGFVTIRTPDGREVTSRVEDVAPHIIAE